jgi:hypothetical protein
MLYAFQCGRIVRPTALTELKNKNIMKKCAKGGKETLSGTQKHFPAKLAFHLSKSKITTQ